MKNQRLFALIGIGLVVIALIVTLFIFTYENDKSDNTPVVHATETSVPQTTEAAEVTTTQPATIFSTESVEQAAVATQPAATAQQSSPSATLPNQPATPLPTADPIQIEIPREPVENQLVIQFKAHVSPDDRTAYLETIGAIVVEEITALNTFVVMVPAQVATPPFPESPVIEATEPDFYVVALEEPNDPHYASQWALPVIGAPQAWENFPENAPLVTVAVIDTGVCADHPDLQGRVLAGYDFVANDTDPTDESGHGCAVAGIIAANTNNVTGIAGIAPNARIMPLRVLNAQGIGTTSDVAAAIIYAVDNGAHIINLSLGGNYPSTILENAVNYAASRNVLVIASSGNSGTQSIKYPAAYPAAIAVGSIDSNLQQSSFTSYGPALDGLAPGRDILSTGLNGTYATRSGTSFAAPQVSGLAALEMAYGSTLIVEGGIITYGGTNVQIPTEIVPTSDGTQTLSTPFATWTPATSQAPAAHPKFSAPLANFYLTWLHNPTQAQEEALENEDYWLILVEEAGVLMISVDVKLVEGVSIEEFAEIVEPLGGQLGLPHNDRSGTAMAIPVQNLYQLAELESVQEIYVNPKPYQFESFIPDTAENSLVQSSITPLCEAGGCTNESFVASGADLWHQAGYKGQTADGEKIVIAIIEYDWNRYTAAEQHNEVPLSESARYWNPNVGNSVCPNSYESALSLQDSGVIPSTEHPLQMKERIHGTPVTEILYDMVPNANFIFIPGIPSDKIAPILECLANNLGVDIISSSSGEFLMENYWTETNNAITSAFNSVDANGREGMLFFQAAGNSGTLHWYGNWIDNTTTTESGGYLDFKNCQIYESLEGLVDGISGNQLPPVGGCDINPLRIETVEPQFTHVPDSRLEVGICLAIYSSSVNLQYYQLRVLQKTSTGGWITVGVTVRSGSYYTCQNFPLDRDKLTEYAVAVWAEEDDPPPAGVFRILATESIPFVRVSLETNINDASYRGALESSLIDTAAMDSIITVTSTDSQDPLYPMVRESSIGPGGGINFPANLNQPSIAGYSNLTTWSSYFREHDPNAQGTAGYGPALFGGTSAATPTVAGAAAIVWSRFPSATASEIWEFLKCRAIDQAGWSGSDPITGGWNKFYGYGRLYLGSPIDNTDGCLNIFDTPQPGSTMNPNTLQDTPPGLGSLEMSDFSSEIGICGIYHCTLREAIFAANNMPGPNTIILSAGNYVLSVEGRDENEAYTGDLDITDDLMIVGQGVNITIIDGGGIDRIFHVHDGVTVTIQGVTLKNGSTQYTAATSQPYQYDGGAILNTGGNLTITDSLITQNVSKQQGSGIATRNAIYPTSTPLTLNNVVITQNTSNGLDGAAIYVASASISLTNFQITDNTGSYGLLFASGNRLTMTQGEVAGHAQGGLSISGGNVNLTAVNIHDNGSPTAQSGGIVAASVWQLTLDNVTLNNNTGFYSGGLRILYSNNVTIQDSTISYNQADTVEGQGGGLYARNSTVNVVGGMLSHNIAGRGGAIYTENSKVTILRAEIASNNSVEGSVIYGYGTIKVQYSCISGNANIAVYNAETSPEFEATYNWWGSNDGPAPVGTGDEISSHVNAIPFSSNEGVCQSSPVVALPYTENFESGDSDWLTTGTTWTTSTETSYEGSYAMTDSPGGPYPESIDMPLELNLVLDLQGTTNPELTYWTRYEMGIYAHALVEISTDDGLTWTTLQDTVEETNLTWTRQKISLSDYIGEFVRFRFRLWNEQAYTADGWWIDDVQIVDRNTPLYALPFNENFENGGSKWQTSATWAISPEQSRSGSLAASDSPGDVYTENGDSFLALIGQVDLSGASAPEIRYRTRYDLAAGDTAHLEVSINDGIDWASIQSFTAQTQFSWIHQQVDLSPYVGERLQLRFRLTTDGDGSTGDGWWIDDLTIDEHIPVTCDFSPTDVSQLIAAIESANISSDADTICLTPNHTYTLSAPYTSGDLGLPALVGETIIVGSGATIERDSSAVPFRLFEISLTGILTLRDVTLKNGAPDGVGGAIMNHGGLYLEDAAFINNAAYEGGAIFNHGSVTSTRTLFTDNTATTGVAGAIFNDGTLIVTGSIFTGNTAYDWGGAIFNLALLEIENSVFRHNEATHWGGGAIYNRDSLIITSSLLENNHAIKGGGIFTDGGITSIDSSEISHNTTFLEVGGGIVNFSTLNISESIFTANSAVQDGGAIFNGGSLSMTNSALTTNTALTGGGIHNTAEANLSVSDSILDGNTATDGGGILTLNGGYFNNGCIVGNSATSVVNPETSPIFDATANWWGAASGPSGDGAGEGDSVGPNVNFSGFLTTGCPVDMQVFEVLSEELHETTAPLLIEAESIGVIQRGSWNSYASDLASGGIYLYSGGTGNETLSVEFTGNSITIFYVKHPALGTFSIELDGMYRGRLSQQAIRPSKRG